MRSLRPPILLNSKEFDRHYKDSLEVYNTNDLSDIQIPGIPCINISVLASVATSVAKMASDGSGGTDEDREPQYSMSLPETSAKTTSRESRCKNTSELYTASIESSKESLRREKAHKCSSVFRSQESANNENSDSEGKFPFRRHPINTIPE